MVNSRNLEEIKNLPKISIIKKVKFEQSLWILKHELNHRQILMCYPLKDS